MSFRKVASLLPHGVMPFYKEIKARMIEEYLF
jgi:hypothetical protein